MTSAELKYLIAIDELYNDNSGIKLTDIGSKLNVTKVSVYRAAERLSLFQLAGDVLRNELSVDVRPLDLEHVDAHVLALGYLLDLVRHLIDARAVLADEQRRLGGVDADRQHSDRADAADRNAADRHIVVLLLDVLSDLMILDEVVGEVLLVRIPLGVPLFDDADPHAFGADFLTHVISPPFSCRE